MAGKNPRSNEFVDYLLEQLSASGELHAETLRARAMFGGYGLYYEDIMFALIADDVLYLKTGDSNRPDFEARELEPFRYERNGTTYDMSYHEAPGEVMDDPDEMVRWARPAILVAHEAAQRKARKKKSSKKKVARKKKSR